MIALFSASDRVGSLGTPYLCVFGDDHVTC